MLNSLAIAVQGLGFAQDVVAVQGFLAVDVARGGWFPGSVRTYIRRKGKILLFDSMEEADDWVAAEEAAQKAIEQAQKTSRRARKRLRERVLREQAPEPLQTVEEPVLERLQKMYGFTLDVGTVVGSIDGILIMQMQALLGRMRQYDEDITMLLFAA